MFSPFTPMALIRAAQYRRSVPDGRRTRPGRRSPDRTRARFQLEGLEERCLLSGDPAITEFALPSTGGTYPYQIVAGSDGNLWFGLEQGGYIGRINPSTDAITEFALPTANDKVWAITAGPDGNVWFTDQNHISNTDSIGMINLKTDTITEYTLHSTISTLLLGITAGPDGNLWFTDPGISSIGMINPTTHTITEFAAPAGSNLWWIAAGPDGNLWFTDAAGSKIGMTNPQTHTVTEFTTPTPSSYPYGITAGPDGNVWFTEEAVSQICNINPTTHAITEFATPTAPSSPFGITTGPDGNLWFAEGNGKIGTINATTHAISEYAIPYTPRPLGITTGPDGNLWFTDLNSPGAIGEVNLTSMQLAVTQQPPTSITAGTPFGLTVEAEDSSGNLLSSFNGTVTVALASNPGGATLGGTVSVTASAGFATFSGLSLTTAASGYTLQVSSSGLVSGITSAVTVTPAAATQVVIRQQPPATVMVNASFSLQAAIEDAYGNVETSAGDTVKVALANNPTGAKLGGTLSLKASRGVATFSGLTLNKVGSGYTLQVSTTGLSGAVTSAIAVTKASGMSVLSATAGTNVPDALLAPLVIDSPDFLDTVGVKKRASSI